MADPRRNFNLPDEDIQFLDNLNLKWESIQEANKRAVIMYGFLFPEVFTPQEVDLKIKMPMDYSSGAALDMFFTNIHVTRKDAVDIPRQTESEQFDGKRWWQWSRHYPNNCKWRSGINNLVTHVCHVQHILDEEAQGKIWN